ncbi:18035_t:CDS:2, partial [Gigaspora margarita]
SDILDLESEDELPLPPDLDQIEKKFKIAILDSLNKYWHDFAREKLRNEFKNLQHLNVIGNYQLEQLEQQISTSIGTEMMQNPFFEGIFGAQDQVTPLDEVVQYLNMPYINHNANSWQWWNDHKTEFPILSLLACKYLCILAMSVLCERLFLDTGNLITPQHTRLGPKIVGKLLFLKCNAECL